MTVEELEAAFEKHSEDEFLEFNRIKNPRHHRPDLCAFLMPDEAVPGEFGRDMVSGAEHDLVFLGVDVEELAKVATDDLIRDLSRCGVRFEDSWLEMFA